MTFSDAAPGPRKLNDGNAGDKCEKYGRSPARLPKEQMT
jgi:hypothetical protein